MGTLGGRRKRKRCARKFTSSMESLARFLAGNGDVLEIDDAAAALEESEEESAEASKAKKTKRKASVKKNSGKRKASVKKKRVKHEKQVAAKDILIPPRKRRRSARVRRKSNNHSSSAAIVHVPSYPTRKFHWSFDFWNFPKDKHGAIIYPHSKHPSAAGLSSARSSPATAFGENCLC